MLAPNPGVPAAPVRDTASGGELSRVMLALMTVAGAGGAGTLVFDEVDCGRRRPDGARRWASACARWGAERQVLCITHLPQIAALAERHFRIEKSADGAVARRQRGAARRRATSWRSCAGCSAPTPATPGRGATPKELLAAA